MAAAVMVTGGDEAGRGGLEFSKLEKGSGTDQGSVKKGVAAQIASREHYLLRRVIRTPVPSSRTSRAIDAPEYCTAEQRTVSIAWDPAGSSTLDGIPSPAQP